MKNEIKNRYALQMLLGLGISLLLIGTLVGSVAQADPNNESAYHESFLQAPYCVSEKAQLPKWFSTKLAKEGSIIFSSSPQTKDKTIEPIRKNADDLIAVITAVQNQKPTSADLALFEKLRHHGAFVERKETGDCQGFTVSTGSLRLLVLHTVESRGAPSAEALKPNKLDAAFVTHSQGADAKDRNVSTKTRRSSPAAASPNSDRSTAESTSSK